MEQKVMRKSSTLIGISAMLLLIACGSTATTNSGEESYAAGAPELAAVQMKITDDQNTEGLATVDDAVDPTDIVSDDIAATTGDAGPVGTADLNGAREAVHDLNQGLRDALLPIAALVRDAKLKTVLGDLREWGPVTRGATEFRLFMRHPAPRDFRWRLDARLVGSGTAFSRIAAGKIVVGLAARRGAGVLGFDLDALRAVDPTVQAEGLILGGFGHGARGTTLAFGLKNFSRDPAIEPGVDALLQEVHLKDANYNRVRLAYRGNVEGTATDAEELVFARVRNLVGVGGRSDMIVTSGDVPADHAWVVHQCWDAGLSQTYRIVRDCTTSDLDGVSCTVVSKTGDESACDVNLRTSELPPLDPNQAMTDAQDPNGGVATPDSMPDDVTAVLGDAGQ